MTTSPKSVLLISPDFDVVETIGTALRDTLGVNLDTEIATLAQMNGSAVKLAANYDVVVFQTGPDGASDIDAIRNLAKNKRTGTSLLALADGDISLTQARALNRAGVDEVLPISSAGTEIGDQISRFSQTDPAVNSNATTSGKVIAVAQARGGIGSTTVAVNLADQLVGNAKKRKQPQNKVALVDLDIQFGSVGTFLDLDEQETIFQMALDGTIPDATFLEQSMVTMPNGLSVLAAPSKFVPLDAMRADQVTAILETLAQTHDYVIVDLPRALVGWIEPVMQNADELIIVTDMSISSVRTCRRLIDFFTADNVSLPVRIVVNHEKKPILRSALHREAAKVLEQKLEHWLPHDPKAANAASDRGKPLSESGPRSHLSKAMALLAKSTQANIRVTHQNAQKQEN